MTNQSANAGRKPEPEGPPSSSTSLLRQIRARDAEAWQRLVALYSPLAYSWCRHFGVKAEDAGDVLQNVFCAVHTGIGAFRDDRPGDTFRGWLWTITRNKIRDYFRAQAKLPAATGGTDAQRRLMQIPESEPEPGDAASGSSTSTNPLLASLGPVRAEFEPRTWQAFWRSTVEGHPTADIATDLGMSVNAVRKAKCRVLRRLRDELQELID